MASHACPFDLLDDDAIGSVLDRARRDRLGNETVPGHIWEAKSWRLLGKRYRATSIRYPSEYNGVIATSTWHHHTEGLIDTFTGGKRYTRLVPPTGLSGLSHPSEGRMQLHIVRHPPTGRFFAITSFVNPDGRNGPTDPKQRQYLLPLPELARKLSGHTALFEDRLFLFDKVGVFGQTHRVSQDSINPSSSEKLVVDSMYRGRFVFGPPERKEKIGITFDVETTLRNGAVYHSMCPSIRLIAPVPAVIPPQLDDAQPGETLTVVRDEVDAQRGSLSALSIAFGYYEPARIAECGGWLVSLWRDNLAAPMLLESPTRQDPTQGLRHRGELALAQDAEERCRRMEATKRALMACVAPTAAEKAKDRRHSTIVLHGGPSAALVIRPRKCTKETVQAIRSIVSDMNQTHNSGRFHAIIQPWDSREEEATTGLVDDQYANPLDPESDSDDESDEEDPTYDPPSSNSTSNPTPGASSSSNTWLSDRAEQALRMRRLVVIDSDDGSDDDGDAAAVRRVLEEDL